MTYSTVFFLVPLNCCAAFTSTILYQLEDLLPSRHMARQKRLFSKTARYIRGSHVSNGLLECLLLTLAKRPSTGMPIQRAGCHHSCPHRPCLDENLAPWIFNFHSTPNIVLLGLSCAAGFRGKRSSIIKFKVLMVTVSPCLEMLNEIHALCKMFTYFMEYSEVNPGQSLYY